MFAKQLVSFKSLCVGLLLVGVCAISVGYLSATTVMAQTYTSPTDQELQLQIALLMAQIAALQGGGTTGSSTPVGGGSVPPNYVVYTVGSEVKTKANLRVRALPNASSTLLGTVSTGSIGVVQTGPVLNGTVNWYKVSFKNGLSGWVSGNWISYLPPTVAASAIMTNALNMSANAEGVYGEIGDFTLEFEVTAVDSDVYIKNAINILETDSAKPGFKFTVEGPKAGKVTAAVDSMAQKQGEVFKINEGETETFELNVWVEAAVAGQYRVNFDGLTFSQEPTGTINTRFVPVVDFVSFRTPFITLNAPGVIPTPARIDGFKATPLTITPTQSVTLTWDSAGTSFCTLRDIVNVKVNLVQANLKPVGTMQVFPGEKYPAGTKVAYKLSCQDASTTSAKVVAATVVVTVMPGIPVPVTSPRFNSIGASSTGLVIANVGFSFPTSSIPAVTGPVRLGTISWGNGVTHTINGLVTGTESIVRVTHTYKASGTYTVVVTDTQGKTATKTITVKLATPIGPTATSTVPQVSTSTTSTTTGVVRGASTDVLADISVTLQNISDVLATMK